MTRSPAPGDAATPPADSRLVVAAAVLDSLARPTAMLCAARSYPAEHAGRYELPGGKVEPGESPVQALERELREEISLSVRLGAGFHGASTPRSNGVVGLPWRYRQNDICCGNQHAMAAGLNRFLLWQYGYYRSSGCVLNVISFIYERN